MTIRRRLFLSNLLMLVIPITVSALLAYGILFVFSGRSERPLEQAFPNVYQIVAKFHSSEDLEQLFEEAEEFNRQHADRSAFIAVASNGEFLFPQDASLYLEEHKSLFPLLLEDGVTGSISINSLRALVDQTGPYRVMLIDQRYQLNHTLFDRPMAYQSLFIFGGLIVIVLVTSRILSRLLTKSITVPLGMLVDGVHQLRDGNLSYRIAYKRNDEFTPVCEDFNDMADYLQKMIDRQQRDEQSRKELLAGISHDLRTPLTSIKAYVEGLLDGIAEDLPTQLKYLRTIRQKAEDIDSLVDKLFLFSKLEMDEYPFRFERLNIADEVSRLVAASSEEYAQKGLHIQLGELPPETYVQTDQVQLHSALLNILENSALYKEKTEGNVRVDCRTRSGTVEIIMADDGPGVPEESLPLLFDVFYRSDPSRQNPNKGSGLGLAITRRIIERMGGSIQAENIPQGGLRVTLTLPLEQTQGEDANEEDTHY